MTLRLSRFKLLYRGFRDTILLVPGWATDYRIFSNLDLDFNYLIPIKFSALDFERRLITALKRNRLDKIFIFGWSMGSFLALDFASRHSGIVNYPIFIASARKRYEKNSIENIKFYLRRNRVGYLYKFYRECFSKKERKALNWFRENLLKSYLNQMSLDSLVEGLDYLSGARIKPECLTRMRISFIHGKEDRIAPIGEALEIAESLPHAEFITMEGVGHMPFLSSDFKKLLHTTHAREKYTDK